MSEGLSATALTEVRDLLHDLDHGNKGRQTVENRLLEMFQEEAHRAQAKRDGTEVQAERDTVLANLADGKVEIEAALEYFDEQDLRLRNQYALQYAGTLLDTFASMAQVPTSFEGVMPEALAKVVMGEDPPPASEALARLTWFCQAEGRVRYIKANAMMEAREI